MLGRALAKNTSLTSLQLSYNKISNVFELGKALATNKALKFLG
jgi:hypothetical protein